MVFGQYHCNEMRSNDHFRDLKTIPLYIISHILILVYSVMEAVVMEIYIHATNNICLKLFLNVL